MFSSLYNENTYETFPELGQIQQYQSQKQEMENKEATL